MVTNGMLIFWIIINLVDLQCPFVICPAGGEIEVLSKIQSAFWHKITTMNLVTVAKFSHIICNAIFMLLFGIGQIEKGLLRPISNYFGTIKTNG